MDRRCASEKTLLSSEAEIVKDETFKISDSDFGPLRTAISAS